MVDIPLTFRASFSEPGLVQDNLIAFGLPAVSGTKAKARLKIAAAAVAAAETQHSVCYSRNANFYTGLKRYNGPAFTFAYVTQTIDEFEAHGLLTEERAKPGSHLCLQPMQSRFQATSKLIELCKDQLFSFNELEIIHMRDADGRRCGYSNTPETNAMRSDLEAVNTWLADIEVRLTTPNLHKEGQYLIIDGAYIRPDPPRLIRKFCRGRFDRGGRYYGWWQNLPKRVRQGMLLNGDPVCEPDFASLHATMLYAQAGLDLTGDPYEIQGFARKQGKDAFNIAVNANSIQRAIGAIQHNLKMNRRDAAALLRAVKAKHSKLVGAFGTDAGVRLQRQDSDIIFHALKELQGANIPALPVHDSMIVPQSHEQKAKDIMLECFKAVMKSKHIVVR